MSSNYYSEDFLDAYEMPTDYPFTRTDNGILWWVELKLWEILKNVVTLESTRTKFKLLEIAHRDKIKGLYIQAPWKPEDPSSHDNTTAIVAYQYLLKEEITVKIWGQHWHPKDVGFYMWCKGGWRRWVAYLTGMWLFVFFAQMSTVNDKYKKRKHGTFIDTDGKILTWVRCQCTMQESYLMRVGFKLYTKMLERRTAIPVPETERFANISTWEKVFNWYFGHPSMPINKIMLLD